MENSHCISTYNGNWFLYDNHNKYMINIHPIIKEIHKLNIEKKVLDANSYNLIKNKFPELTNEDLKYYLKKYVFLKENNFFSTSDIDEILSAQITSDTIRNQLANLNHLVFQVTNNCNMQCRYCCYGELYNSTLPENQPPMTFETARTVIDFLIPFWNSSRNTSHENQIDIGFYGGEPLLNFKLVSEIVEYVKKINLNSRAIFKYNLTTNALLLHKYIDFLAKHDFSVLISLDGNEEHDSLRVDKNNRQTFKRVYQTLKNIQKDYPNFFSENIEFNSVINQNSSAEDIFNFINKEFGKTPMMTTISTDDLNPDKIDEFKKIFGPYTETQELKSRLGNKSNSYKKAGYFFYYHLQNSFRQNYELIIETKTRKKRIPTGTCLPFWKKMFVSAENKIYACERIGLNHILGKVDKDVHLDFEYIAQLYNDYFDALRRQCTKCHKALYCSECFFQFDFHDGLPVCRNMESEEQHKEYLSNIISILENNPEYFDFINKMVFA